MKRAESAIGGILIVDLSYKKDSLGFYEFVRPIADTVRDSGEMFFIKHYSEVSADDLAASKKAILCGTALKDNKFREDIERFSWIKEFGKPLLGICAGFQVIGLIFGARLIDEKGIGMRRVEVLKENVLIDGRSEVYNLHGASLENLEEFDILSGSDLTGESMSVQAIKHKSRDIYGIAFHPEVRHREVIENFLNIPL